MLPAVVPVLVGPLQTLLALAPALLIALGGLLFALFTPRGWRQVARFFWHQKLLSAILLLVAASLWTGQPWRTLGRQWSRLAGPFTPSATGPVATRTATDKAAATATDGAARSPLGALPGTTSSASSPSSSGVAFSGPPDAWPMFRGGAARRGLAWFEGEPRSAGFQWTHATDTTIYSSPCVVGDQLVFATADGIGPFSPAGRGAIVSLDLATGRERWRYAPDGFRATFCSPVAAQQRIVCGEGLHLVQDARVTCLDLAGQKQWEFRTRSHVEATPCVADGRVFVGAGDDGFYCLSLREVIDGAPRVLWHLPGERFPDCESPPVEHQGVVYFGLGLGGQAVCAVDAATGEVRWRTATPHPAFAPPAIVPAADGRPAMLVAAIGRGNFVQSADELLAAKLDELREENAPPATLDAARRELGPAGELWWLDFATGEPRHKFAAGDTILGGAAIDEQGLSFGSRDGRVYRLSHRGELRAQWEAREPIVTSLVAAQEQLFVVVRSGRLYALDRDTLVPRWDMQLGEGENFLSSPVLARRRLYVGTPANGLRCLGQDAPPVPPVWNHGLAGGPADDRPLPLEATVAWIERGLQNKAPPSTTALRSPRWCPTPTSSSIVVVHSGPRESDVVAYPLERKEPAWAASGQPATDQTPAVKTPAVTAPAPRGVWTLEGVPRLPPCAVGERLILAFDRQLVALDTSSGSSRPLWQVPLEGPAPQAMLVDHQRLVLASATQFAARSVATGELLYVTQHHLGPMPTDSGATATELPLKMHLADDLLLIARGTSWAVFDSPTGRPVPLMNMPPSVPATAPLANPPQLADPPSLADPTRLAEPTPVRASPIGFLWRADAAAVLVDDRGSTRIELEQGRQSRHTFPSPMTLVVALPIATTSSAPSPLATTNSQPTSAANFADPDGRNTDSWLTLSAAGELRLFDAIASAAPAAPAASVGTATSVASAASVAPAASMATLRWEVAGLAPRPPLVAAPAVIAMRDATLLRISLDDGQESDWWRWPDATLAPATPLVAVRGRVYYLTAQGWLVCLAEAP